MDNQIGRYLERVNGLVKQHRNNQPGGSGTRSEEGVGWGSERGERMGLEVKEMKDKRKGTQR